MKWPLLIFLLFTNIAFSETSGWLPKSYEKIDLNNKNVSEGVMFVVNTRKNHNPTYSLSYVLDARVIRNQPIPKEMYESLRAKLSKTVVKLSEKDLGQSCPSRILWKAGEVNKKPTEQFGYCLNPTSESNFTSWYQEVRQILQL